MGAVAEAENSQANAGHSLEVFINLQLESPHALDECDHAVDSRCNGKHPSSTRASGICYPPAIEVMVICRERVTFLCLQVADAAGTEVERRWNEPYRKYKVWNKVSRCLDSSIPCLKSSRARLPTCARSVLNSLIVSGSIFPCGCGYALTLRAVVQSVRQGKADQGKYHTLMRKLLVDVKRRAAAGKLLSTSVAGHLLNIRQALLRSCFCMPMAASAVWPQPKSCSDQLQMLADLREQVRYEYSASVSKGSSKE